MTSYLRSKVKNVINKNQTKYGHGFLNVESRFDFENGQNSPNSSARQSPFDTGNTELPEISRGRGASTL